MTRPMLKLTYDPVNLTGKSLYYISRSRCSRTRAFDELYFSAVICAKQTKNLNSLSANVSASIREIIFASNGNSSRYRKHVLIIHPRRRSRLSCPECINFTVRCSLVCEKIFNYMFSDAHSDAHFMQVLHCAYVRRNWLQEILNCQTNMDSYQYFTQVLVQLTIKKTTSPKLFHNLLLSERFLLGLLLLKSIVFN